MVIFLFIGRIDGIRMIFIRFNKDRGGGVSEWRTEWGGGIFLVKESVKSLNLSNCRRKIERSLSN